MMLNHAPPRPDGDSRLAHWARWVESTLGSLRTMEVPGALVHRTTNGVAIIPRVVVRKGIGLEVATYKFVSLEGDFFYAKTWNLDTDEIGTENIEIALPAEMRESVETETIDGDEITYSGWNREAQTRLAETGQDPNKVSETQVIVPRYLDDKIIWALKTPTGVTTEDDKDVAWQDMNFGARAYSRKSGSGSSGN